MKRINSYDPQQPLAFDKFHWPQTVLATSVKPAGNYYGKNQTSY